MTRTLGAPPLRMTNEQRDELEMARSFSSPYRAVVQAEALLLAADGAANHEIARRLGVASNSVRTWRRRFEECGTSWIGTITPGGGGQSSLPADTEAAAGPVTRGQLHSGHAPRGTTRAAAEDFGLGQGSGARSWRVHTKKARSS
jgi:transposase-like protein